MNILKVIAKHLKYWSESYIHFPVIIGLCLLAIYGINLLTGRPLIDSPDAILGWFYNLIGGILTVMITGFTQKSLFGYRCEGVKPALKDDIYDSVITIFLLIYFYFLIWS
jgi:hypothetical protein